MRTLGIPIFGQKNIFPIRVRSGPVRGGIKPSQNGVVLGLKLKPYLASQPLDSILYSFSATRFSLLCSQLSLFSVSHFLTPPPVHSVLSFSLPHSTGDGRRNGRGNCGSKTCSKPTTRGLPLLWYFLISFLILDLIALIVVWVCGIFVNML
jgi:hypothetical protein